MMNSIYSPTWLQPLSAPMFLGNDIIAEGKAQTSTLTGRFGGEKKAERANPGSGQH